jgi:hypothetical protein
MGMMKMNLYVGKQKKRSISYFYNGRKIEEAGLVGSNRDRIVSEVIGRIIMSDRNKEALPGDEEGAVIIRI